MVYTVYHAIKYFVWYAWPILIFIIVLRGLIFLTEQDAKIKHGISFCPGCGKPELEYFFDYCHCNHCDRSFRIKPTNIRVDDEARIVKKRYGLIED